MQERLFTNSLYFFASLHRLCPKLSQRKAFHAGAKLTYKQGPNKEEYEMYKTGEIKNKSPTSISDLIVFLRVQKCLFFHCNISKVECFVLSLHFNFEM